MTELDDRARLEVPCLQSGMSAPWRIPELGIRVIGNGVSDGVPYARYRLGPYVREWRGLVPSYLAARRKGESDNQTREQRR